MQLLMEMMKLDKFSLSNVRHNMVVIVNNKQGIKEIKVMFDC